jgi:hypothetical protein
MGRFLAMSAHQMSIKPSIIFRIILGVVATLLLCYCGVVIFGEWFLVPRWPGYSLAKDLALRAGMTLGCIAVGTGCVYLAEWCLFRRDSKNQPQ